MSPKLRFPNRNNLIIILSFSHLTSVIKYCYFIVDGNGAGFGNLEIIVNGGRVTSHVSTVEPQKKFSANFIPHEAGRHRIDVKFNGEKIGSPRFVEV